MNAAHQSSCNGRQLFASLTARRSSVTTESCFAGPRGARDGQTSRTQITDRHLSLAAAAAAAAVRVVCSDCRRWSTCGFYTLRRRPLRLVGLPVHRSVRRPFVNVVRLSRCASTCGVSASFWTDLDGRPSPSSLMLTWWSHVGNVHPRPACLPTLSTLSRSVHHSAPVCSTVCLSVCPLMAVSFTRKS